MKKSSRTHCFKKPAYSQPFFASFFLFLIFFIFLVQNSWADITIQSGKSLIGRDGAQVTGSTEFTDGSSLIPDTGAGCFRLGNLTLASGSILELELGGTTECTQYDQLEIIGTVDLTGATLNISALDSFVPTEGDVFVIVDNDDTDPVTGTFSGLAEGATISFEGKSLEISYVGGSGNDVILATESPKIDQTITFGALDSKIYGDADFTVSGTASSGLSLTFSSETLGVCSVSGSTVSLVNIGTCTVRASQDGNDTYNAAPVVDRDFTVSTKTLTASGLSAQDKEYDGDTIATLGGSAVLSGVVDSDDVGLLNGAAAGNFSDANVGTNKTVTVTGLSLSGTDIDKYTLAATTLTASITKIDQSITFASLSNKTYGDAAFLLSATASSGLAVNYANSTTSVCTLNGNTVTLVGPGTCSITASQGGNTIYNAAVNINRSFGVAIKNLTVSGLTAADKSYDGNTTAVLGGTGVLNGVVSGDSVILTGSSSGNFGDANVGENKLVTISGLSLAGADNGKYSLASITTTASITKATQTITFGLLSNKVYGVNDFAVNGTASSGLAVSYSSSTPSVCSLSTSTVSVDTIGSCTIVASQSGDSNYDQAVNVSQSFTITLKTISVTGLTAEDKEYDGSTVSSIIGVPSLSGVVSGDTVNLTGTPIGIFSSAQVGADKTVTINGFSLTGADGSNYKLSALQTTASITKLAQTIDFDAITAKTYGDSFSVTAVATSSLSVLFSSTTTAICTVSGTTVTSVGHGTCTLVASQLGNTNYSAASDVSRNFVVSKVTLSVSGLSAVDKTYDGTTQATISGSASLVGIIGSDNVNTSGTAEGAFNDASVGTGKTVTISGLALTGSDAANYLLSTISTTASITRASQSISFSSLSNKVFGDADFQVMASASSGLPVSLIETTYSVCRVDANTVTLFQPGECTITASQSGNSNYNAAVDVSQSFNVLATVTPTAGEGGTISPSSAQAVVYNDTVQLDILPASRFEVVTPIGGTCGGSFSTPTYTTNGVTTDCTVEASFSTTTPQLTITLAGSGDGSVTSDIGAINCPGTCSYIYSDSDDVTLTATPKDNSSSFVGWSGDTECGSNGVVTMGNRDVTCIATFYKFPWNMFLPQILYNIKTRSSP